MVVTISRIFKKGVVYANGGVVLETGISVPTYGTATLACHRLWLQIFRSHHSIDEGYIKFGPSLDGRL